MLDRVNFLTLEILERNELVQIDTSSPASPNHIFVKKDLEGVGHSNVKGTHFRRISKTYMFIIKQFSQI